MRFIIPLFFIFTSILAEVSNKDAVVADDTEDQIRLMVKKAFDKLLESYNENDSETLVAGKKDDSLGDQMKSAKESFDDKVKDAMKSLEDKTKELQTEAKEKYDEAKKDLNDKKKAAGDYLGNKKEQAKADLEKIKEKLTHYYQEITSDDKSSTADKPADSVVAPVKIQPVNADAATPLHSQASMWSAMLVLLCVVAIAGGITYFVQEKDVITYSQDSEMERLYKGNYYQSQDNRVVY